MPFQLGLISKSFGAGSELEFSGPAVFCKVELLLSSPRPVSLPATLPGSKWPINVFSMALYQAYSINYSPVPIIIQVIRPFFHPPNCTKVAVGEEWCLLAASWILHAMETVCSAVKENDP